MPPKKRSRSNSTKANSQSQEPLSNASSPSPTQNSDILTSGNLSPSDVPAKIHPMISSDIETNTVNSTKRVASSLDSELENIILRSKVVAPDISGIRSIDVNHDETLLLIARENGSLVLYHIEYYQNIPHFTLLRHTGGRQDQTITRIRFMEPFDTDQKNLAMASFLSGQIVIYDVETLFPISIYQRTGGAIWDFSLAKRHVYAAISDGSWHQLFISTQTSGPNKGTPQLELQRIIPKVTGSDRALSVYCDISMKLVVGTDNVGNVFACSHSVDSTLAADEDNIKRSATELSRGIISNCRSLWTARLPKGMGMCVATASGPCPVVAVGTSVGDVVLLDASNGRILKTFSHHKGPVSTIESSNGILYASGWHESLRSYRCTSAGEWYAAEVKRRTHYHEATAIRVTPNRQLLFSASRDGTIMYSPVRSVFSDPGMYLVVTTQQFAFARHKNLLLHSRQDRIEVFRPDESLRHWIPLFAHQLHGKYHLNKLWCDQKLDYMVFSTDERVVVVRISWRKSQKDSFFIRRIDEVAELPSEKGLIDCCFVPPLTVQDSTLIANTNSASQKKKKESLATDEHDPSTDPADKKETDESTSSNQGTLFLLYDSSVVSISLSEGFTIVRTSLNTLSKDDTSPDSQSRNYHPLRLLFQRQDQSLCIFAREGTIYLKLYPDGSPDTSTFFFGTDSLRLLNCVPQLYPVKRVDSQLEQTQDAESMENSSIVGLLQNARYVGSIKGISTGGATSHKLRFPVSLPHDAIFRAELPHLDPQPKDSPLTALGGGPRFIASFSKGLLYVTEKEWRMFLRTSAEAVFVMKDNKHILVLERNLEKTLESLPMCWKVRRFGN